MDDQEFEEKKAIILDNGSGYIKCGFGGEEGPRCVLPNIIGYPKYKSINTEEEYRWNCRKKKTNIKYYSSYKACDGKRLEFN